MGGRAIKMANDAPEDTHHHDKVIAYPFRLQALGSCNGTLHK